MGACPAKPPRMCRSSRLDCETEIAMLTFQGNGSDYRLDLSKGDLLRDGKVVQVAPKEWQLLLHFVTNPGVLFSTDELVAAVWDGLSVGEDTVTQAIHRVRKALGDPPKRPVFISTKNRRGYKFIAQVTQTAEGRPAPAQLPEVSRGASEPTITQANLQTPAVGASQTSSWVQCHGTKFEVPTGDRFWNELPLHAKRRFWLIGNSNKSWLTRDPKQSAILGDAIVRICLAGGSVCILSGTDQVNCVERTIKFLRRYVFNDRKESREERAARIEALIAGLNYSTIDGITYRAVVADDRALIIPLLNSPEFRDESMVIELNETRQSAIFEKYCGDIERLREKAQNYFPDRLTSSLTAGRVHHLTAPAEFASQLRALGIVPRDLVFYVTSSCNLRCSHCYVGSAVLNAEHAWSAKTIAAVIQSMDLDRLTIVGGEPLLFPGIVEILGAAAAAKVSERRLTTNLTTLSDDLIESIRASEFRVSVSLDGADARVHDSIRGKGQFDKTVGNLRRLVAAGVEVEVTHTVTPRSAVGFTGLVELLRALGVLRLNLHKVSPQGNALDNRQLVMSPTEWRAFLSGTVFATPRGKQPLTVRYPLLFATPSEYAELQDGGYHHHAKGSFYSSRGHRLVLYANGEVYVSSEAFGTDSNIGKVVDGHVVLNSTPRNELVLAREKTFQVSDINAELGGDPNYPISLSFSYRQTVTL